MYRMFSKNRPLVRGFLLFLCLLLCVCGCGCGKRTDFLDVFRRGFTAELTGALGEQPFSGTLEMLPCTYAGDGTPLPSAAVFTFYAPETLLGTVLARDASGALSLTCGELTVSLDAESGFCALFALFPVSGDITEVQKNAAGHTEVRTAALTLTFLPDGTPLAATAPRAEVTVLKWNSP